MIPTALRAEILERIHTGHQGRERCKRLARNAVFWSRINQDINMIVDKCLKCLKQRNNPQRDSLRSHTIPNRAWQKIGIDMFSFAGKRHHIIVDYFSKWVEVAEVPRNAISNDIIMHLDDVFSRFGLPECIMSDGDPLYTSSRFKTFCVNNEIDHDFSSARYPQSNVEEASNISKTC